MARRVRTRFGDMCAVVMVALAVVYAWPSPRQGSDHARLMEKVAIPFVSGWLGVRALGAAQARALPEHVVHRASVQAVFFLLLMASSCLVADAYAQSLLPALPNGIISRCFSARGAAARGVLSKAARPPMRLIHGAGGDGLKCVASEVGSVLRHPFGARLWGVIFLFAREASKVGVLSMVGMVAGVAVALCGL